MSDQPIKAINFKVQDVGKHVKGSKKRYQWTISLKGKIHTVGMDFSFISGKVKVVVDNRTLLENELPSNVSFQYPFTLDGFSLNCIQQGQNFQLRINNKVFTHLYNQQKTKVSFKNYEDEVKDISVNQSAFHNSSKTVKLNIGAFGQKKKTVNKAQSDNWGAFGKNQGFPSYFGQQSSSSTIQSNSMKKNKNLLDDEQPYQHHTIQRQKQENSNSFKKGNNKSQQILIDILPKQQQQKNNNNFGGFEYFDDNPQKRISQSIENMFATMAVGHSNYQKQNQPNPLDFFSVNMSANQQVNVQALKKNHFQIPKKQQSPSQINSFQQTSQFITTQNLFNTDAYNNQQPQQVNIKPLQNAYQQHLDFNTMQLMFNTNSNPNAFNIPQIQKQQPQLYMEKKQQTFSYEPQPDNFNTMNNLFSTNNAGYNNNFTIGANPYANMQKKQREQQPIYATNSAPNNENFNTLQNFFQTISNPSNQQIPNSNSQPKIDPNNSEDIFKSMGLNFQQKPKVPMNTMGGGIELNFQTTRGNTFNTTQGIYGFDFPKANTQQKSINDLI